MDNNSIITKRLPVSTIFFNQIGLDKQKRVIIFLLEIGSCKKGVMKHGMGTYYLETF
jgi:hypothetical protein